METRLLSHRERSKDSDCNSGRGWQTQDSSYWTGVSSHRGYGSRYENDSGIFRRDCGDQPEAEVYYAGELTFISDEQNDISIKRLALFRGCYPYQSHFAWRRSHNDKINPERKTYETSSIW